MWKVFDWFLLQLFCYEVQQVNSAMLEIPETGLCQILELCVIPCCLVAPVALFDTSLGVLKTLGLDDEAVKKLQLILTARILQLTLCFHVGNLRT